MEESIHAEVCKDRLISDLEDSHLVPALSCCQVSLLNRDFKTTPQTASKIKFPQHKIHCQNSFWEIFLNIIFNYILGEKHGIQVTRLLAHTYDGSFKSYFLKSYWC